MSTAASGVTSQVITLPKGGGALQGLGEKFVPDLHTGTGSFTVPVTVPAGRNGFQPDLTLAYSTGSGNGPFGLGWSLGVPGVTRRTAKGIPRYEDESDVFVLSGAEDLVRVGDDANGRTRYRPRTEGLFALIERRRDASNDVWEVRGKDGLVSVYGTLGRCGDDPAVLASREDSTRIFGWHLTETRDLLGNQILYEYAADEGQEAGRRWRRPLLTRIRYADHADQRFLVSVTFEYAERPDPFSEYRAGFEMRTSLRCTSILTTAEAGRERSVRRVRLTYLDQRPDLAEPPANGVSLLCMVEVLGYDDAGAEHAELPALEFGYTRFEPSVGRDLRPLAGVDPPASSLGRPEYELADLTGNGLPDILELNGAARFWANLGDCRFDAPRPLPSAPDGVSLADPGVQMIDADGDGRIDLLITSGGVNGFVPLQHVPGGDGPEFHPHANPPTFDLTDPEVRLVDLDGDGVVDALRTAARLEHYFNHPDKGWDDVRAEERRPLEDFPDVLFSDPHVRLADMSGDGLQDIVRVYDGTVEYWPQLGHRRWGSRITTRDAPRLPYGYDPRRVLLGDVDGDGLADLLYVEDTRVTVWVNRSGNGWSEPIVITGTPAVTDIDAVRLIDLRGTGVAGVLWSADQDGLGRPRSFFLDLTGSGQPYLLDRMDNHLGAVTEVAYATSTACRLADDGDPATRWRTPLPFPVQVVDRVDVTDAHSATRLTTRFRYHDGYWDGAEREFRGFGLVERFDAETGPTTVAGGRPAAPPTCTKTWFHQGPIGPEEGAWFEADPAAGFWAGDPRCFPPDPGRDALHAGLPRRALRDAIRALRGHVLRTELYALDGTAYEPRPFVVTETWLGVREEEPLTGDEPDRTRIFFPFERGRRTTQWERGDDPATRFAFTDDHDNHGQPRLQTDVGCPRGWRSLADRPGAPYLGTRTRTTYAVPSGSGPFDRVAAVTVREYADGGDRTLPELLSRPDDQLAVVAQTLSFYDGDPSASDGGAFVGLPLGRLGDYGALVRTERLALTDEVIRVAYDGAAPPYLAGGTPAADHPGAHLELVGDAGYVDRRHSADAAVVPGLFVATDCRRYDFHAAGNGRGLVVATRTPRGHETTIGYDEYGLLPVEVTDPAGNHTTVAYDYRTFRPLRVTDANGNDTVLTYTPLGLPASVQRRGGSGTGDQSRPSVRFSYDLRAYERSGQPISVATVRHVHRDTDTDVPLLERDQVLESREYSDGFGRVVQTRALAEDERFGVSPFGGGDAVLPAVLDDPGAADVVGSVTATPDRPNVVVTGLQVYDNKGRVVEAYEPFHDVGWEFAAPTERQQGERVVTGYDPLGRPVRVIRPDGSEERIVHGIPGVDPEHVAPSPWEVFTYDANDNAGHTHPDTATGYRDHWDTPSSTLLDTLGRTVASTERTADEQHTTRYAHDIRGNVLTVTDALGRPAFAHVYDLLDRRIRLDGLDSGLRLTAFDAAGQPTETRDARGAWNLTAHDALGRLTHRWARDAADEAVTLREHLIYGEDQAVGLSAAEIERANLRGALYRHDDEAGRVTIAAYDIEHNPLEQVRQVIDPAAVLAVVDSATSGRVRAYRVDWSPGRAPALDVTSYVTTTRYDALGRPRSIRCPADATGHRAELRPGYNRAGALDRLALDGTPYVERIAYDARGRRVLVAYGNGVLTRLAYDRRSSRLVRMRTEAFRSPAALTYRPAGQVLQDLGYRHDLAGNLLGIDERTPGCGVAPTRDRLSRTFVYDPLYRLLSATGREANLPPPAPPWTDTVRSTDSTLTRAYTQDYRYDAIGNLLSLGHTASGDPPRREFTLAPGTNRLASLTIGQTTHTYAYDAAGNMTREDTSRHFEWDALDRLRVFRVQATTPTGLAEPSQHVHYLYDGQGVRVMKIVRPQAGSAQVTVYVGGLFEHHRWSDTGTARQNTHTHVMDGRQRIAVVRRGDPYLGGGGPDIQYHLGDHLGSSNVVVGGALPTDRDFVAREEYYPYGETSFGGFGRKRYRFSGKERDEESGLAYFGARYYAPWLGRWTSCDPAGPVDGLSLYQFVSGRPLVLTDPLGLSADKPPTPPSRPSGLMTRLAASAKHPIARAAMWILTKTSPETKPPAELVPHKAVAKALKETTPLQQLDPAGSGPKPSRPLTPPKQLALPERSGNLKIRGYLPAAAGEPGPVVPIPGSGSPAGSAISELGSAGMARLTGIARNAGAILGLLGPLFSGLQIGHGVNQLVAGAKASGATDIATGGAGLGVDIALASAAAAGTVTAFSAAVLGAVAGGGIMAAAGSAHAAIEGEPSPIDVMDKAYDTHFGDMVPWVTGTYEPVTTWSRWCAERKPRDHPEP